MKAATLLWCISTTVITYSHAFIIFHRRQKNYLFSSCSKIFTCPEAQIQPDDDDDDDASPLHRSSFREVDNNNNNNNHRRRTVLISLLSLQQLSSCCLPTQIAYAAQSSATEKGSTSIILSGIHDPRLQNYYNPLLPNWKGTALPGPLTLSDAYSQLILPSLEEQKSTRSTPQEVVFPMAKWPDPILRKATSPIPQSVFQSKQMTNKLQLIAETLKNTARQEGAVGLAAQQCGIDASLIYIDGVSTTTTTTTTTTTATSNNNEFGQSNWRNSKKKIISKGVVVDDDNNRSELRPATRMGKQQQQSQKNKKGGIFLVNPRIVHRSLESDMLVWTEECLVLPPEFKATLLRDADVTIEYETLTACLDDDDDECGKTKQITLRGELARCAQHEMDHDKGILITDHVGLDELLSIRDQTLMADVEDSDGLHANRMQRAYAREIDDSLLLPSTRTHKNVDLAFGNTEDLFAKIEQVESDGDLDDGYVRHPWFVQSASAIENITNSTLSTTGAENAQPDRSDGATTCDGACLEERKRRIQNLRAMMEQSRSSKRRGDVLELSRQRALMYGTSYKGLSPSACSKTGSCP